MRKQTNMFHCKYGGGIPYINDIHEVFKLLTRLLQRVYNDAFHNTHIICNY